MKKPPASEVFKDYVPEVIYYDEKRDFGDEWLKREEHLKTKEELIKKIREAKSQRKGNKTTYRLNIRTENIQGQR